MTNVWMRERERALNCERSGASRGRPTLRKPEIGEILRDSQRERKREGREG